MIEAADRFKPTAIAIQDSDARNTTLGQRRRVQTRIG